MSVMTSGDFAPATWSVGFLKAPFENLVSGIRDWYDLSSAQQSQVQTVSGSLRERLMMLEPLTLGRNRELIASTPSGWCAWFSGGLLNGTEPTYPPYLAEQLECEALTVACWPTEVEPHSPATRYRALQFDLHDGRINGEFGSTVRSISLTRDSKKLRFEAFGTVQDFEDVGAYERRLKAERFTVEMFTDYCKALGKDFFKDDFYSGPSAFISTPAPSHGPEVTFAGYKDYLQTRYRS